MNSPSHPKEKRVSAARHFAEAQAFVREANRATSFQELSGLLENCTGAFGFDYFAIVHHVATKSERPEIFRLHNFPESWMNLLHRGSFADDPIHAACQRTTTGFLWSDIGKILNLNARHKDLISAAGSAGMGDGFTIPVHIPGEHTGSCSFVTRCGRAINKSAIPAIYYMGSFAFEAARRIVISDLKSNLTETRKAPEAPSLTQRQFDCVVLAAKGKSDGDIAQLLGISPETVHQHMEDAKRRYQVATRMQLVVRTLFDSQLSFADILR